MGIGAINILLGLIGLLLLGSPFPFNYDVPVAVLLLMCVAATLGINIFQQFRNGKCLKLTKYKAIILGAGTAALLLGILFLTVRTRLTGNLLSVSIIALGGVSAGKPLYDHFRNMKTQKNSRKILISLQGAFFLVCSIGCLLLLGSNYTRNQAFAYREPMW